MLCSKALWSFALSSTLSSAPRPSTLVIRLIFCSKEKHSGHSTLSFPKPNTLVIRPYLLHINPSTLIIQLYLLLQNQHSSHSTLSSAPKPSTIFCYKAKHSRHSTLSSAPKPSTLIIQSYLLHSQALWSFDPIFYSKTKHSCYSTYLLL